MADRVSVAGIAAGAVAVIAAIALSIAIAFVAVNFGHALGERRLLAAERHVPPKVEGDVTLQPAPSVDIARFRDEKRRLLDEYGWVDRDNGFARVPIERAMAMLVDQSAKGRPQ